MKSRNGYEIEHEMMKIFRGKSHCSEAVDFQTKNCLWEVKSCKMLHFGANSNSQRGSKKGPFRDIIGVHLGRFPVIKENHELLQKLALEEKKEARYLFVITLGKQKIKKTMSWLDVDVLLKANPTSKNLKIKDIFSREISS